MIILYIILALLVLLIFVLVINTLRSKRIMPKNKKVEKISLDSNIIAKNLSNAIKFKTITSDSMEGFDEKAFLGFHDYLEKTYPKLHSTLKKEIVNQYSLLYKWESKSATKKPMVLMSHMDVVPIDERTLSDWEQEPFSGKITDGYVWGRGTLDMKGHLISVCEAVEYSILNGYEPNRDIYLAFGHDEESMGSLGANKIVDLFRERKISPEYVVDEGGAIIGGEMLGASGKLGLIGICEKGYADITIEAKEKGGHASQPPNDTAVSQLSEAILLLKKNQLKPTMNDPLKAFLKTICPHMSFLMRMLASNLWLFKGLLIFAFGRSATSRALTKTTYAPTMLKASTAPNVLAQRATAVINFRISPDDSVDKLKKHIEHVLRKTDVKIVKVNSYEPSIVSDINSESYELFVKTANDVMPDIIMCPYLTIAATDSRLYSGVADNIYRFSPFRSMGEDLGTIHANGERIKIDSLTEGVEFFIRLLDNSNE